MNALRKSVIAGSWYPGNPSILRRDIENYFNSVPDLELEGEFKHGHVYTRAHNGEQYHDYHPHPLNYYNYLKKIGLPLTDASLDFAEQSMRLIEITTTEEQMFAAFNTIISDRNTKLKSLF